MFELSIWNYIYLKWVCRMCFVAKYMFIYVSLYPNRDNRSIFMVLNVINTFYKILDRLLLLKSTSWYCFHWCTLTKKNYSKLQFTIVYYTSKLWYYGTLDYYGKLWYYGQNYGTINKTMALYWELWNFDLRRKNMVDYQKLRNFDL